MATSTNFPPLVKVGRQAIKKPYEKYGAMNKQACFFQNGLLYTADGRVIPDQIKDKSELKRIAIPTHLNYLLRGVTGGGFLGGGLNERLKFRNVDVPDIEVPEDDSDDELQELSEDHFLDLGFDQLEPLEDDDEEDLPYREVISRGLRVMDRTPPPKRKKTLRG